jgi:hypothetical protein
MAKRRFKVNWFDGFVIVVLLLACLIAVFALNNKPYLGEKTMLVKVKIDNEQTVKTIMPKVVEAGEVYFSGTKYPVKQASYETHVNTSGAIDEVYVTLSGLGQIKENDSIFNGQRIYVNKKVEIRNDYFAQGYVVDYRYE